MFPHTLVPGGCRVSPMRGFPGFLHAFPEVGAFHPLCDSQIDYHHIPFRNVGFLCVFLERHGAYYDGSVYYRFHNYQGFLLREALLCYGSGYVYTHQLHPVELAVEHRNERSFLQRQEFDRHRDEQGIAGPGGYLCREIIDFDVFLPFGNWIRAGGYKRKSFFFEVR